MKKDWGKLTAGVVSGLALVVFLTACESTGDRSPGERQAMGEKREGLTPSTPGREGPIAPAPEAQKAPEPEKDKLPGAKQEKGLGGVAG